MPVSKADQIATERLLMRRWRPSDREPFAALNADRRVMELLPGCLSAAQSDAYMEGIEAHFERHGFGLWALQVRSSKRLIGLTGLNTVAFDAHFTPAVEVGWRLAHSAWGHGYATEAARAALAFGFERVQLDEIVSMTSLPNSRSRAVMQRIGMSYDPSDDFDHPLVRSRRMRAHVLFRLSAARWSDRGRRGGAG
jgi:RimJ/RimL family protein N-acetyltransferase